MSTKKLVPSNKCSFGIGGTGPVKQNVIVKSGEFKMAPTFQDLPQADSRESGLSAKSPRGNMLTTSIVTGAALSEDRVK